ncbi:MAG: ATP-binding protein [Clostridiales bacterium]|nr:ATP-binding protein [Clostridiales bacterium]
MEKIKTNPFTLDFGREPYEMIPRSVLLTDLVNDFMAENPSSHISIITGVRGSGKTVFMTSVCKRFKEEKDWVVVELNPDRDLLQNLAAKLNGEKPLKDLFSAAKINLSAFGVGVQISGTDPEQDIEVALTKMLTTLKKHNKKVLVAIDEVSNTPSMKVFASAYQIFLRQELPIFLLMTGLFENVRQLQDQKTLTFLYRAPRMALEPLNMGRMADSYARIFELSFSEALEMAKKTKGFSFAFQVLGYFTWKYRKDNERIRAEYKQYLEDFVYEKIWQELSSEDRRVLYGIAKTPSGNVAAIRKFLEMDNNRFTPYRTRLIRKGIVNGNTYGVVRFALPLFENFVLEHYGLEE